MKATEVLQKMIDIVDDGNAPFRGELKIGFDIVDDYYGRLLDCLDEARIVLAAKSLGSLGGKSRSDAKRKSSAANGKKGGRPKKTTK